MARVVSMATRIKISRSLKGNRNAYRGGPKAKLTARQKVANINSAITKKKGTLSQAQLENRRKAAQRLRAAARREEAGIKPNAPSTKPLPTPASVKSDPDVQEARDRAKGKLPTVPNHRNFGPPGFRENQDVLAEQYLQMHGDKGLNRKIQQLEKRKRLNVKEQGELGALQRLGDTRRSSRVDGGNDPLVKVSQPAAVRYKALKDQGKTHNEIMSILNGKRIDSSRGRTADRIDAAARRGKVKR
jgi:hypothetical protein